VDGVQPAPGRQVDLRQARALARLAQVRAAAEPEHADAPDVALQQRVDRLRRRVRDELDVLAADLLGDRGDRAHDAGRDALLVVVRRRQHGAGDDRAGLQVAGDRLGEGSPDVDADARASAAHDDDGST
jgi:hypothetical protein